MVYVVRWFPLGPEVSVACQSLEEVVKLADEISATNATIGMRVTQGDQEIDLPGAKNAAVRPFRTLN